MCARALLDLCSHYSLLCWVELRHVRTVFPVTELARGVISPAILLHLRRFVWRACSCANAIFMQRADEAEWSPICELLQIIVCVVWGRPASHKIVYMCSLLGGGRMGGWKRERREEKWRKEEFNTNKVGLWCGTWDTHRSRFLTRLCVTSHDAVVPVCVQALSLSWGNLVIYGNDRVHREILIHCKSVNDPCRLPRRPTTPDNIKTVRKICREIDAWTGSSGHPRSVTVIFYSSL